MGLKREPMLSCKLHQRGVARCEMSLLRIEEHERVRDGQPSWSVRHGVWAISAQLSKDRRKTTLEEILDLCERRKTSSNRLAKFGYGFLAEADVLVVCEP